MTVATIAPHIDNDVHFKPLTELHRHARCLNDTLWVVRIDVKDRRLNLLSHVSGIGRKTRLLRRGRIAELIIYDYVYGAARAIPV